MKKVISILIICGLITGCSLEAGTLNSYATKDEVNTVSSVNETESEFVPVFSSSVSSVAGTTHIDGGTSSEVNKWEEGGVTSSTDTEEGIISPIVIGTEEGESWEGAEDKTDSDVSIVSSMTLETTPVIEEPTWVETELVRIMYINTKGIYSRKSAIMGSATVKKYSLNDKVSVVAITDTNYYKLDDGTFIHKDYLSNNETVVNPVVTEKPVTVESPKLVDAERLLNSAKLNPLKTNDVDVDRLVSEVLGQIINDGMSTYQKVVAIYNYIIETFTYGKFRTTYWSDPNYHMAYDGVIAASAYGIIMEGRGVCDDYASLFVVMTRRIGLESYIVSGQIMAQPGVSSGHTWVLIKLDGEYYVFDAQVDQANSSGNQISHKYFCVAESSVANIYTYGENTTMWLCEIKSAGKIGQVDNARDYSIALFGDFVVDEGEKNYVIKVGY